MFNNPDVAKGVMTMLRSPTSFAGLWESFRWPDETVTRSFTILAVTLNAEMAGLHRMPMNLAPQDWPMWLGEVQETTRRCCAQLRMD